MMWKEAPRCDVGQPAEARVSTGAMTTEVAFNKLERSHTHTLFANSRGEASTDGSRLKDGLQSHQGDTCSRGRRQSRLNPEPSRARPPARGGQCARKNQRGRAANIAGKFRGCETREKLPARGLFRRARTPRGGRVADAGREGPPAKERRRNPIRRRW